MKPIKKWNYFAWQNRVPNLSDAFFLAGTMLFATLVVYGIFDLDLWGNAGSFLLVGLSFFLYAILMLVAREWRGVLHLCFFVWTALLGFDVWLRTFLKITYGVPAESPMVLQSLANTQSDEFREGFLHTAPWVFVCTFVAVAWFALAQLLTWNLFARSRRLERLLGTPKIYLRVLAVAGTILLFAIHFIPNLRMANPVALWVDHLIAFNEWKKQTANFHSDGNVAGDRILAWSPRFLGDQPRTVVLVIGESTNRNNWSLYGYERKTTPYLEALNARGELLVFRDVLAGGASTVPALRRMLTLAEMRDESKFLVEPDVLQLAHAAGYKIFWLSNQNDTYIRNLFASSAQVAVFTNDGNADEVTLDEALLPAYQNALDDPTPLKLIVLHLMGAHPYYQARVPERLQKSFVFDKENPDSVEAAMLARGRFDWVINARNDYDCAMIYQDELLKNLIEPLRSRENVNLLYVSDHAQEVGHTRNFTGHDPNGIFGYTVPMVYWQNKVFSVKYKTLVESRAFQTDMLFSALLNSVLQIKTQIAFPQNDIFDAQNFRSRERFYEYTDID